MELGYDFVHKLFAAVPEAALFLSLALGYWVGKVHFGSFQLGGVAGSLLMAVIVSQFGVHVDNGVKNVLFALFIYAVGFTSGPQFFRSLGKQSIKEIILSAVLAVSGLATVVILARLFSLDKGLAAGIAAGGLTQSAIMGTAESAIHALPGLTPGQVEQMVSNISVGYGVTYIFGSLGAIIVCVNILPKFMGRSIRDDAVKAEAGLYTGGPALGDGEHMAISGLVGRLFRAGPSAGKTVADIEAASGTPPVTIERIKRKGTLIPVAPQLILEENDVLLVVGKRPEVLIAAKMLGEEQPQESGMELRIQTRDIAIANTGMHGKTLKEIQESTSPALRHGLYIVALSRDGKQLPIRQDTTIKHGDIITLYGSEQDVQRVASKIGYSLVQTSKTDLVYMGFGLLVGLVIGYGVIHFGNIPVTLGSGGGALLSGLLFGWFRTRHMQMGSFPEGAAQLLKDLGLSGFVVVVGLNYGMEAVTTIAQQGISIFFLGALVTLVPLIITMFIGKYVLRYENTAIFAGALAGTRSANPAFGEVLNKAENAVPTAPFAITYGLANVFLTLLGPLIVALV